MGNDVPGRVGLPLPGFLPEPVDVVVGFVVAGVDGAAEGACEGSAVGSAVAVGATGSGAAEDTIGAVVAVDVEVVRGAVLVGVVAARIPVAVKVLLDGAVAVPVVVGVEVVGGAVAVGVVVAGITVAVVHLLGG